MLGRPVRAGLLLAILAAWAGASLGQQPKRVELVGKDLSAWRKDTGTWQNVGAAQLDPNNPKALVTQPGSGVLVNGPAGRTSNLLSQYEHGDVEAHVEFMVPQGSNSGVYFQGRYEIQILDSWKVEKPTSGDCSAIYQRWSDKGGYEGHAPRVNASLRSGRVANLRRRVPCPAFRRPGEKDRQRQVRQGTPQRRSGA